MGSVMFSSFVLWTPGWVRNCGAFIEIPHVFVATAGMYCSYIVVR